MNGPSIQELNHEIAAWEKRNRELESVRGYGLPNRIKAKGGNWLAKAAKLTGESIRTVKVNGTPRPAICYRGIWFINYEKGR